MTSPRDQSIISLFHQANLRNRVFTDQSSRGVRGVKLPYHDLALLQSRLEFEALALRQGHRYGH